MIGQGNPGEPGSVLSNVINNANLIFNKVENQTYAGTISGSGTVTKQGAGILTLPNSHTYTGATNVAKGKLNVTGALANTAVTVSAGASLGGTGSIAGQVTVIGGTTSATRGTLDLTDGIVGIFKLNDGNSADTVLTLGDTAPGASSSLNFEVGATADLISILTGKIAVNPGGGIITITPASGFTYGTYDLIQFPTGQASGLSSLSLATSTLPGGYTLALQSTPTAEQLVVTPEPGTLMLIALTMFPRRRRARSRPTPAAASPPAAFR
jgi:fibronectin-binding autotransporter adhesin